MGANSVKKTQRGAQAEVVQAALRAESDTLSLPRNVAVTQLKWARQPVEFFGSPGELVVDTFAGPFTTARAAEDSHRRWLRGDKYMEHVLPGTHRLESNAFCRYQ